MAEERAHKGGPYEYDLPRWRAALAEFEQGVDGVDAEGRRYIFTRRHLGRWMLVKNGKHWNGWPQLAQALRDLDKEFPVSPLRGAQWVLQVVATAAGRGEDAVEFNDARRVTLAIGDRRRVFAIDDATRDERPGYGVALVRMWAAV